ncbi:MAG: CoA pyrophosphatase [Anaerolineae bacterium]|nr:CoA pyrophosphatase [Anaerolineae bacterium]
MIADPTLDDIHRALTFPGFDHLDAWLRMAPRPHHTLHDLDGDVNGGRSAGVLILLYPVDGRLTFVLTRRTETVATHRGQISLPGGAFEPQDRSLADTALRETCEELSTCEDDIQMLGSLTPLHVVVSGFVIHPFVAYTPLRPDFRGEPTEVAEILEMPLADLLDDAIKVEERWDFQGVGRDIPFYRVNGLPLWGATAIILSEFEMRLRAVLNGR